MKPRLLLAALALLSTLSLSAQDTAKLVPSVIDIDPEDFVSPVDVSSMYLPIQPVTVYGERIMEPRIESPYNFEVIEAKGLNANPTQSFNEMLTYTPGIDIRQRGAYGAQADLSIRGGTFEQSLLLFNGIKMNDPQTGHHMLNIPLGLDIIKSVNVYKGPVASKYGLNALSGAIDVITVVPYEERIRLSVYAGDDFVNNTGNKPELSLGAALSASLRSEDQKCGHYFSLAENHSAGYRPHTGFLRLNAFYQGDYQLKKGLLNLYGSYLYNDFGANSFYAFPVDTTSAELVKTSLLAAKYTLYGNYRFVAKAYWRHNDDTYTLRSEDPDYFQNVHHSDVLGTELHVARYIGKFKLGLGADFRHEQLNSSNLGERQRQNIGGFGEVKYSPANRLHITAGTYLNYNTDYGFDIMPSVGINWSQYNRFAWYANFSTGIRQPTYTDLYYNGPTNIGNPDLEAETSWALEAGGRFIKNDWNEKPKCELEGSIFYQKTTNLIDWVREVDTLPWQPQNFAEVTKYGFDGSVKYLKPIGRKENVAITLLNVQYTYIHAETPTYDDVFSRYALNNLQHQLLLQGGFTACDKWSLLFNSKYQQRVNMDGYWLLDTRLSFAPSTNTNFFVDVNNILNTEYNEVGLIPLPGRWYRVGANFNWGL